MPESVALQMAKRGVVTIPKALRDAYDLREGEVLTLLDLGGVFVLSPRRTEVDALADRIGKQWAREGRTLPEMLKALRQERDRRGR